MTVLAYGVAAWLFLVGLVGIVRSRNLIGVVICLAMIIFWKWLAHGFLERDENYYDN